MNNQRHTYRAWDTRVNKWYSSANPPFVWDEFECKLVVPEGVIMLQSTGLKDKVIHESDIIGEPRVTEEAEVVGVVKFDEDEAAFIIEKTNGGWEYLGKHFMFHKNHVVIGNTLEHNHLLTESNQEDKA